MKNNIFIVFFVALSIGVNAQKAYIKEGIASFYADKFEGRQTANGEVYYHVKKTAAHRTLPFGTVVKVTNLENNKYVVVRINDRGPFVDNRIIDLSKSAASNLDFVQKGLAKVRIEIIASTEDLPNGKKKTENTSLSTYYKLNSELVNPKGKGVQIASFKDNENVFRLIEEVKKKYNEEIFIEVAIFGKKKLYRIILGNSTSKQYLDNLKQKLSKEFPKCFIVEFK